MSRILNKTLELARALYPTEERAVRNFHVSAIWRRNQLLSVGVNNGKTHTRNARNPKHNREGIDISSEKFSCSEIVAMLKLGKMRYTLDFSKCILVNARITRENKIGNSRCCESCRSLVNFLGFKRVYYTNNAGEFEEYK